MLALVVALAASQLEAPPLPPPPEAAVPASPTEPPEVRLVTQFLDRHLLSIDGSMMWGLSGLRVRRADRTWSLSDSADAFQLVPEAAGLARQAQRDLAVSRVLYVAGLSLSGLALGVVVTAALIPTIVPAIAMGMLLVSLATCGVALVLALVALPFAIAAERELFEAVAAHNRGLLQLRPPPGVSTEYQPSPGGLVLSLP